VNYVENYIQRQSQTVSGVKRLKGEPIRLSCLALALASVFAQPALAADFTAANGTDFATDIGLANASSDASSTITLTQSFQLVASTVTAPTKALTIDTQGFTLTGNQSLDWANVAGTAPTVTLVGTFTGAISPLVGGAITVTNASIVNDGALVGYTNTLGGVAGTGATLNATTTLINNGSVTGGDAPITGSAGAGVSSAPSGPGVVTLENRGTIQGGNTNGNGGGLGVNLGSTLGGGILVNTGTIRGGSDLTGATIGGAAVQMRKSVPSAQVTVINSGALIGGNGAAAVIGLGALSLTNSGTIQAGGGGATAIQMFANSGALMLELQAGSNIEGNVVALATSTNALILGGDANDSFDASLIGNAAQYQNFNLFEKTGASTWTLTNATTAVTPWTLTDGVLQISSDANLGDPSGGLTFNGGTLENTADITSARAIAMQSNGTLLTDSGTTLTLNGVISGAGALTKAGAGTLLLNAGNTYAGGTTVEGGTLAVGDAGHTAATIGAGLTTVAAGATLGGYGTVTGSVNNSGSIAVANALSAFASSNTGTFQIAGDLSNAGVINVAAASGQIGNVLNVTGNYAGANGQVVLNTQLNAGGAATHSDQLVIGGNASGTTGVKVNASGAGVQTAGDGIRLIQVAGTSVSNSFHLATPVQSGVFEYLLYQGGAANANDWYLRSELEAPAATADPAAGAGGAVTGATAYRPGVVGYSVTPMLNFDYGYTVLGRLHERVGDVASLESAQPANSNGIWGRLDGQNLAADTGDRFSADEHTFFAQFGKDWTLTRGNEGGSTHAGATLTIGSTSATFDDSARSMAGLSAATGSVETQAQTIGGYWTKYLPDGSYFDGVGQLAHYQNRYGDIYGDSGSQNGFGAAVSGEVGKPFSFGSTGVAIEPQAQLLYQYLHLNHFDDGISEVGANTTNGLRGRLGFRLFAANLSNDTKSSTITPEFTADVLHDFFSPGQTTVASTSFDNQMGKTWYDVGVGITGSFGKNSELYANVKYEHSISGEYRRNVFGQAGYRFSW
jgi:outer membrane autotransporter protein